jgi:hypothetical protein
VLLTILTGYYINHKPIDALLALRLVSLLWSGLIVAALSVWAGATGSRWAPLNTLRGPTAASLQAALGFGLLSLIVLGLGAFKMINGFSLALVLLGGLVISGRQIRPWLARWRDPIWNTGGRAASLIRSLIAVLLILVLIYALAPPLKFDALVYHLTLPQEYLRSGGIDFANWLMFWGMPQLVELNYLVALQFGGLQAAALLGWTTGFMALIGAVTWLAQHFGIRSAWIGAAALVSGFTTSLSLGWAYTEWWALWYGLAVLVLLSETGERLDRRQVVLAGVFAGLALSTKYSAGMILICGVLGFLFLKQNPLLKKRLSEALWRTFAFGMTAVLVSSPWWIKNVLATGNPFYPFLFPAGSMTAQRLALYQNLSAWGTAWQAAALPWTVTILGREGAAGPAASVGPLLLGFAALAWIGYRDRAARNQQLIRLALFFSLIGWVSWALLSRGSGLLIQTRLYSALFPAFLVLAAAGQDGLARLRLPGVRLGRLALVLVILVLSLNLVQTGRQVLSSGALPNVVGLQSDRDYLRHNLGMYALVVEAIAELPPGSQTLMLWEPRSLNCRPSCFPDETLDRWATDWATHGDFALIQSAWREAGFTHLLVFEAGRSQFVEDPRFEPGLWTQFDSFVQQLVLEQDFNNVYQLYRLNP